MPDHDTAIAIIIGPSYTAIRNFMNHYNLPCTGFIKVTEKEALSGLEKALPVIYLYGDGREYAELVDAAKFRFASVRYMDY